MVRMNDLTVNGMILMSSPIKEYDRRAELLTCERGRISAFASGARKVSGGLAASTVLFTFGEYMLYEGRSSYNIKSAVIKRQFEILSADYDAMCHASYFAEVCRYFTRENIEAADEVNLMYMTLTALEKKQIPYSLIRIIFEYRMMMIQGESLEMFTCLGCGREDVRAVYIGAGGVICESCVSKDVHLKNERPVVLSHDAMYALQYILTADITKLYTFNVSEDVMDELRGFMKAYLAKYMPYKFKTLAFIE